ncbi:autotransporter-associated beta strand repeat-containing protein [Luteolibacter flavescens]|uniref:Autotransporter-associated beta strand repeat-containing protein n=1 Tax=Luteolibacter flavescens TaxID=1859460 RepID=A0ABT3FU59_9BACT|nr:autotransporter-associated beta strand repeat-containing protein [Luteolibacter flavescens]MCW1887120.1 autotransporter-associated beta strand repeat-containing protein [Luteolibacter flavescens]
MKSITNPRTRASLLRLATSLAFCGGSAFAASNSWIAGNNGKYADAANWTGGVNVPGGASDNASSDGVNSVIHFDGTVTLNALNLNLGSGATVFNQSGGSLTLNSLGFGGGGGSRNPTYNLSGGTVTTGAFPWGNGNNARFNVMGGSATHSGSAMNIGVAGGANGAIVVSSGSFSHTGTGQLQLGSSSNGTGSIVMSGGTFSTASPQLRIGAAGGGIGHVTLSGDAIFNAIGTGTANAFLGNNGGTGSLTLGDTAQFNATGYSFVVGQFGNTAGNKGTLTIGGGATMKADRIVIGGENAASAITGIVNLNGGTISTGSIRLGSTTVAASATANVLNANGGTLKAMAHANNSNFLQGIHVALLDGGLRFDTDGNDATITNVMSGTGGIEKLGEGTLFLTGANAYAGDTTVAAGVMVMGTASLHDDSTLTIGANALLDLTHGIEDVVGELRIGNTVHTSGTWGSSGSMAQHIDDVHFAGSGVIRVGSLPVGQQLTWTGRDNEFWGTGFPELNFKDSANAPAAFATNDHVTFDDSSTVTTVLLSGMIQAGTVTFAGAQDWEVNGIGSGFGGGTGFVVNGTGTVSLGGTLSSFTGPIVVNSGVLKMADTQSFGTSSGITVAAGAQVDLNGRAPGAIHSYTLGGSGPGGAGAIINSSVTGLLFTSSVKNLTLTGNATIGSDGGRFDVGPGGGIVTGNGHTLTKVGTCDMAFRGDASATPIHYVIQTGTAWAENTANAWGGATGTLTVKTGARAGTYGALNIATPVIVESGGTLHNQGNGTGTWSGGIALQGSVSLDSAGGAMVLGGPVTGSANLTKLHGNDVTITAAASPGNVAYTGNTTVEGGRLIIDAPFFSDTSHVTVAAGALLRLNHGTQDTIDALTLAGTPAAAGVWGAIGSGALNTSDRLEGTGTLLVLGGAPGNPYDVWSAQIANPADRDRADDPDGDGFTNESEFLFGGSPVAADGSLVQVTRSGANLIVRWKQRTTGVVYQLQESATMAGASWAASGVTPAAAADQTGVPAGYTRMEAIVPIDGGRKFVRVSGTEN